MDPQIPIGPLLGEARAIVMEDFHRRLHEQGFDEIRPGHGCVFRFIDHDGSRLTELADRSGLTKQAVGEVVADLEALGYVERVGDPVDRRAKTIRLTPRGSEAQNAALAIFAEIERDWAARVGEKRMAVLREVLEDVVLARPAAAAA